MKSISINVSAVSILVLLGGCANKANEKPNVVIIFIDDKAQNMAAKVLAWRRSMPVEIPQ